jgi:hypothetical protein
MTTFNQCVFLLRCKYVVSLGVGHSPIVITAGCPPPCALRYHVGLNSPNFVATVPHLGFEKQPRILTSLLTYTYSVRMLQVQKQSLYRSGQALRFPWFWGSQISWQSAHGGKVVNPTHRPPLPSTKYLVLISVRGWVNPRAIVRQEWQCQWKITMTPTWIEPATFRLVAQCLTELRLRVPL